MIDSALSWRPETWLDYLLIYLVPGLCMASYFLLKTLLEKPSDFAKSVMKIMGKDETWLDKLKEAGGFGIGIACVIVAWPGFVVWLIKDKRDDAIRQKGYNEPNFNCLPQYLIAQVNPIDAENASFVIDPLATVPALPFGHLNKGWVNFLANMTDDRDEMWSFFIPKGSECGKHRFAASSDIRGFARVRDGKVLGEFITESD